MNDDGKLEDPLKNLKDITTPDERHQFTVGTLDDLHAELSSINLHSGVPAEIRQHFETAKNVALYTWFVYRFHQVAEMQAYSSLEMALRIKIAIDEPSLVKITKRFGLAKLISLAVRCEWIGPNRHYFWDQRSINLAWSNYYLGKLKEARDSNKQIDNPEDVAKYSEFLRELNAGYVNLLKNHIHETRNALAHGSMMLHPWSTTMLRVCAEFINQLFIRHRKGDVTP